MDAILTPPVSEGTSHEYACTFREANSANSPLTKAAISSIKLWLDDARTGTAINSRTNLEVFDASIGSVVDVDGEAVLTLKFTAADAKIVATAAVLSERHRITLQVTYTKVGGGTGHLTHRAYYDVVSLERISA